MIVRKAAVIVYVVLLAGCGASSSRTVTSTATVTTTAATQTATPQTATPQTAQSTTPAQSVNCAQAGTGGGTFVPSADACSYRLNVSGWCGAGTSEYEVQSPPGDVSGAGRI